MTKICNLLGSRPEVMYECMYTTHKTQKRKIWHDGFVALYTSRRLVVYADDEGKAGKIIDETKLTAMAWDCKDEEHIETSKFLLEIVNETPVDLIQTATSNGASGNSFEAANTAQQSAGNQARTRPGPPCAGLGGRTLLSNSKFRTPLHPGSLRQTRPGRVGHPSSRNASATNDAPTRAQSALTLLFNFDRNPTSEWSYVPNVINRTPEEVLALLEK